jgi:hypothetical protein
VALRALQARCGAYKAVSKRRKRPGPVEQIDGEKAPVRVKWALPIDYEIQHTARGRPSGG